MIGGNEGLGTNAIHFIDLFSWFTGNYSVKLNGDFLLEKIFPNKRGKNLLEFAGTIFGSAKNSTITITFLPFENLPLILDISTKNKRLIINETNEKIFMLNGKSKKIQYFKNELVSDLTIKIVDDIIKYNDCLLPNVHQSYTAHKELFRIFNIHIKKIFKKTSTLCPIS